MQKQRKGRNKRKVVNTIPDGIVHIQATDTNTIIVLTDMNGTVVDWISGGRLGLKGAARATSFAAERMARWVIKQITHLRWKMIKICVRGFGQGRFTSIRTISKKARFRILLVKDVSRFPYGGCRPKKRRRI